MALEKQKAGANYAASSEGSGQSPRRRLFPGIMLDGVEKKYIEEVGSMNIFFKINGTIVTPVLNGSILPGVTRNSCIELCKSWGYPVEERKISADELFEAAQSGALEEVWGTGTAAVVSPVGNLRKGDVVVQIQDGGIGEISQKLYDTVTKFSLVRSRDQKAGSLK